MTSETVTLSPKYQVVIPRRIRTALGLKPGQKIQAIHFEGRIELIPLPPIQQSRGFLKGLSSEIDREQDR